MNCDQENSILGAVAAADLVGASRPDELSLRAERAVCYDVSSEACFGETPKPSHRGDHFYR